MSKDMSKAIGSTFLYGNTEVFLSNIKRDEHGIPIYTFAVSVCERDYVWFDGVIDRRGELSVSIAIKTETYELLKCLQAINQYKRSIIRDFQTSELMED